jgi:hypothetical protein
MGISERAPAGYSQYHAWCEFEFLCSFSCYGDEARSSRLRPRQFEKIFVVGLPARSDRRDGMVLQAALSDMQIEFIDGVMAKDVPDKAIPSSPDHERLPDGPIGCWRAHMNAARE